MKSEFRIAVILTLLLCVVTGCKRSQTAEEIIKESKKRAAEYESVTVRILGSTELSEEGSVKDLHSKFEYQINADRKLYEDSVLFLEGKEDAVIDDGGRKTFSSKNYIKLHKNTMRIYSYDEENQLWNYLDQEFTDESFKQISCYEWKPGTYDLEEHTVKQNDTECYVMNHTMKGKELGNFLAGLCCVSGNRADPKTDRTTKKLAALLQQVNPSIHIVCYINKESMLPYQYEVKWNEFLKERPETISHLPSSGQKAMETDAIALDIWEEVKVKNPSLCLTITCEEFHQEEIRIPNDILSHATEAYLFSLDSGSLEGKETDPLYEPVPKEEAGTTPSERYEISDKELEKALEELERNGWDLEQIEK